ncbi:D-Ala-D-Ala carboxypeptidase family metallohydrolase [Naumannella cuiyingiana]|uniref:Peptidoglycan hydrolase-like protein with peptidoglycan-binding domain n=1 Tax=Naumannella cuiyingiana TaxID=1347891 RepID=A0A7Z0IKN6_9ACTN|nr:D-Ala-D-Ala carboxypeptidase family metallohydrolase [Naumannella cuiyingiana]NYI70804.1 peptidoglycan hydrolase-like protein with peptidoglycan-binding domain [Naumannella cuiyingiana]
MSKLARVIAAFVLAFGLVGGVGAVSAPTASAYDWKRELASGDTGADVKELQIRIAGFAADGPEKTSLKADGDFGPATEAALKRFQKAHGLTQSGKVDGATQDKLNSLEDSDGSTKNFEFKEFASKDCGCFTNGKVGESEVKENVRQLMWKLEAIRTKAGDKPITVNSGFRTRSHNSSVGGASNSQHMYGIAGDIVVSGKSPSQTADLAKSSGFSGVIIYNSFTHVDSRADHDYGSSSFYWANA